MRTEEGVATIMVLSNVRVLAACIFLVICTAPIFTGSANAQTGQASVKFSGIAAGECQVLIEGVIGPPLPKKTFIGQGNMVLRGSADANEYQPNQNVPNTFYITYESVRASGVVSARWDGQMINAKLYSEGDVRGFFVDEGEMKDLFTAGVFQESSHGTPHYLTEASTKMSRGFVMCLARPQSSQSRLGPTMHRSSS